MSRSRSRSRSSSSSSEVSSSSRSRSRSGSGSNSRSRSDSRSGSANNNNNTKKSNNSGSAGGYNSAASNKSVSRKTKSQRDAQYLKKQLAKNHTATAPANIEQDSEYAKLIGGFRDLFREESARSGTDSIMKELLGKVSTLTGLISSLESKQNEIKNVLVDTIKKSEKHLAEKQTKMGTQLETKLETEIKTVKTSNVVQGGAKGGPSPSKVKKPPKVKMSKSKVTEKEFATLIKVLKMNLSKEVINKKDVCMTLPKEIDPTLPYAAFYHKLLKGETRISKHCKNRLKVLKEDEMRYFLTWMPRYEEGMASERRAVSLEADPDFDPNDLRSTDYSMDNQIVYITNKLHDALEENSEMSLAEMAVARVLSLVSQLTAGSKRSIERQINHVKNKKEPADVLREAVGKQAICKICETKRVRYGVFIDDKYTLSLKYCQDCVKKRKKDVEKDMGKKGHDLDDLHMASFGGTSLTLSNTSKMLKRHQEDAAAAAATTTTTTTATTAADNNNTATNDGSSSGGGGGSGSGYSNNSNNSTAQSNEENAKRQN